jgi:hypothetical protein
MFVSGLDVLILFRAKSTFYRSAFGAGKADFVFADFRRFVNF